MHKFVVLIALALSACTSSKIKNSPQLPRLDLPSFSYEEAIKKEHILLERAKHAKFPNVINAK